MGVSIVILRKQLWNTQKNGLQKDFFIKLQNLIDEFQNS